MPVFVTPSIPAAAVTAGEALPLTINVFNAGGVSVTGTLTVPFDAVSMSGRVVTSTGFGSPTGNTASASGAGITAWTSDSLTLPSGATVVYEIDDTTRATTDGLVPYTVTWAVSGETSVVYTATGTVNAEIPTAPIPGLPAYTPGEVMVIIAAAYAPVPSWIEAVPSITITTGSDNGTDAKGITVRLYDNPSNLPLPTRDNWSTLWWDRVPRAEMICASFDSTKHLPAPSVLTVDGRTERMTMECGGLTFPADPWVYTASNPRWSWPQIDCGPVIVVVLIPGVGHTFVFDEGGGTLFEPGDPLWDYLTIPPVTARIDFHERIQA